MHTGSEATLHAQCRGRTLAMGAMRVSTLEEISPSSVFKQVLHHSVAAAMGDCTLWFIEEEEEEELLLLTLALNNKRERKWVHKINLLRVKFGEYHHLMQELEDDEEKFQHYFRLSPAEFNETLSLIKQDIKKQDEYI